MASISYRFTFTLLLISTFIITLFDIVVNAGNFFPNLDPPGKCQNIPYTRGILNSGDELSPGDCIDSRSASSYVIYQKNGYICTYHHGDSDNPTWCGGAYHSNPGHLVMQGDGNLCTYDSNGNPKWCSHQDLGWDNVPGASLYLSDTGRLIITPIYDLNTMGGCRHSYPSPLRAGQYLNYGDCIISPNGQNYATYQLDNNFCSYTKDGSQVWCSGGRGYLPGKIIIQEDGNFCDYEGRGLNNAEENPIWCFHQEF